MPAELRQMHSAKEQEWPQYPLSLQLLRPVPTKHGAVGDEPAQELAAIEVNIHTVPKHLTLTHAKGIYAAFDAAFTHLLRYAPTFSPFRDLKDALRANIN